MPFWPLSPSPHMVSFSPSSAAPGFSLGRTHPVRAALPSVLSAVCQTERSPSPLVVTVTFLCLSRPRSSGGPCFRKPLTCTSLPVLQGQNQGRCPPALTIPCTCMSLMFAVGSSRMETCSLMHLILPLDCEPLEGRYFCLNQLRMSIYLFILVSLDSQRIGVWLVLAQNKCSVTVK